MKDNSGTVIAVILAIITIVLLYTSLTTIVADYCVEKRMDYPGQYESYGNGMYAPESGLTGYRLVIDVACYVVLPIVFIGWIIMMYQEQGSVLLALGTYLAIIVAAFVLLRLYSLKRVLILAGIWLAVTILKPKKEMGEVPVNWHDDDDDKPVRHSGLSMEDKVIRGLAYGEMAKKWMGYDNMYDNMDEETEDAVIWTLTDQMEREEQAEEDDEY